MRKINLNWGTGGTARENIELIEWACRVPKKHSCCKILKLCYLRRVANRYQREWRRRFALPGRIQIIATGIDGLIVVIEKVLDLAFRDTSWYFGQISGFE